MSENSLKDFFNNQSDEEKTALQSSMDKASSEGGSTPLKVSGSYLMEVPTYAFTDKKTQKMRVSPEYKFSEQKGSLILTFSLRVADGAPGVPKGSSLITSMILSPAKGANKSTFDNIARLIKPRLSALTGEKQIYINADWIEEWLIPTFEDNDGEYKMIKDHKMKQKVMVEVEDDVYNNQATLSVKAIRKAKDGDKSAPNEIVDAESTQPDMKPPTESEGSTSIESIADSALEPEQADTKTPETALPDDF